MCHVSHELSKEPDGSETRSTGPKTPADLVLRRKKHHVGPKPEACVWRDLGEGELLFCLEIILVNQPPSLLDNP